MHDSPELDRLRDWDAGAAPLDDDTRHRVRARLLAAMRDAAPAPAVRPRRTVLRVALTGAVAAAVAATTLVAVRDGDGGTTAAPPGSSSSPAMRTVSARTVLDGAAAYQRAHERTVAPRDDQFVYTKEIVKETDRKTGATKTYVDENWHSVDDSRRSWVMELGKGWWSDPPGKNESHWPTQDWTRLKQLPTDPDKLLKAMRAPSDRTPDYSRPIAEGEWPLIQMSLAGLLYRIPVMPAGLRAAAYEALGKVPGVKATPGVTDARGREGIGITYTGGIGLDSTFVFDPETYAFLGFRSTRTSGDGADRKTYTQLTYLDSWAIVDKARQRP
ncbi:CU044_5270 family protein [Streptomyces sp. NPDC059785]|uniref:CU044_5270 family protein n=1 Tax=Streptomyces sp. NPDC059785 TaxID=3346945 RepID=UPI003667D560